MPTNRRRTARTAALSPAAIDWARSEDAATFFALTDYDYSGTVHTLPEMFPWFDPVSAWLTRGDPERATEYREELAILQPLHALYRAYQATRP